MQNLLYIDMKFRNILQYNGHDNPITIPYNTSSMFLHNATIPLLSETKPNAPPITRIHILINNLPLMLIVFAFNFNFALQHDANIVNILILFGEDGVSCEYKIEALC